MRSPWPFRIAAFFWFGAAAACSSRSDVDDDSESECGSLRPDGPLVVPSIVSGDPFPATGGPLANGSYGLSAVTAYADGLGTFLGCEAMRGVFELDGGSREVAVGCYSEAEDPSSLVRRVHADVFVTSDTELTLEYSCPPGLTEVFQYAVEPAGVRMFIADPDDPGVFVEYSWALPCDEPPCASTGLVLRDENNYGARIDLTIPSVTTAPAVDLEICWDGITQNLACQEVTPELDVDTVALIRFSGSSGQEVAERLAAGALTMADVDDYVEYHTDGQATCARLSDLSFFGTSIDVTRDYVENEAYQHLLVFARGETPQLGVSPDTQTMMFLTPTSTSANTSVVAVAGCGMQATRADLSTAVPVPVSVEGPWVVNFGNLTRDGMGNTLEPSTLDTLELGFFENLTLSELGAEVSNLEAVATRSYSLGLSGGRSANLANALSASGEAFPGFDTGANGVWLLTLTCSTCLTPLPAVLAVLEPVAGP